MNIRIVVADDHNVVREGLRSVLLREPDFELVGEVGDGLALLERLDELQPDIVLLDVMMPGLNGLDATRQIVKRFPHVKVCILSMFNSESYVLKALSNGALGYVVKSAESAELVRGLREIAAGRRFLSPPLTQAAVEAYLRRAEGGFDIYETLSDREREVMHLLAEGLRNVDVASRLCISPRTVETHRAHIMSKLGLNTPAELIRFAYERGIVGNPPQ